MPSTTHAPADIQRAFAAVGREITQSRAAAVTGLIVEHGFHGAMTEARQLLGGDRARLGYDAREYAAALNEANTPTHELIGLLAYEAKTITDNKNSPYWSAKDQARVDAIEARIGRLVALTQAKAA